MFKQLKLTAIAAAVVAVTGIAKADDFKPAIIFDMGGKFDKSFNEAGYNGAEAFKKKTGIEYMEFEVTQVSQREQATKRMARKGADIVVAMGFAQAAAVEKAAKANPDTKFTIIDMVVDLPNVQSVVFKEHEAHSLLEWPQPWHPKQVKSDLWAEWIFPSSANLHWVTRKVQNLPILMLKFLKT